MLPVPSPPESPPSDEPRPTGAALRVAMWSVDGQSAEAAHDLVAVEEPLEIQLLAAPAVGDGAAPTHTLALTMRTPGSSSDEDLELALGYLYSEGIIASTDEVAAVAAPSESCVVVSLRTMGRSPWPPRRLERYGYMSSACGVCGKSSLSSLAASPPTPLTPADASPQLDPRLLHELPLRLRAAQVAFRRTGGLHAAGLFSRDGQLRWAREDVGRHNAVDKLLGAGLLADLRRGRPDGAPASPPYLDALLVVSGRASFELVQKARMAAIPILVAIGAPSSLAIRLARDAGMTLVGFARDGRYNVYCGRERLALCPPSTAAAE